MADNVQHPITGTGTADVVQKTDDLSGAHVPYFKILDGTDGGTDAIAGTAANGLDVDVTRVSGNVAVVGAAADGAAVSGNPVRIAGKDGSGNTQDIATDSSGELQVDVLTLPAVTNGGTFVVQENGAALTALQLIDDPVATLGTTTYSEATTKGMIVGAVRRDADTTLVDTTNEIGPLQMDANGRLKVEAFSGETLPVSLASVPSHAVTNAGTFAVQVDGSALTALQLIDDPVQVLGTDTYTEATSKGMTIGAVRRDADTTLVNTTNEFGPLQMDANGRLKVEVFDGGESHTVDAPVGTPVNVQIGNATLVAGVIDETGASAVDALAVGGGTAHDAVDSGNPIKQGFKASSALPTAVAAADRANGISDLWGRQLVSHIDPGMQIFKAVNVTTAQTGTDVWSPTSGKKIAVTYLGVSSYGTTAARVILWFGDNADTTYTAGTDQVLWAGSFAPSSTSKPGMIIAFPTPVFCTTADRELHLTTDAGISLDITVYGYEW